MTVTVDHPALAYMTSSLTTASGWQQSGGVPTASVMGNFPSRQLASRELMVDAQGPDLPQWFGAYLNSELNRLFGLPASWDGSTADEVTIEAVSETVAVLASVVTAVTIPPQFFPLADGGIQVEWHVGGNDIEIEVDGTGSGYVLATRASGDTVADGEIRATADEETIRRAATFLNELSSRRRLAHLSRDVSTTTGTVL